MKPLFLGEDEVRGLVSVSETVGVLEETFLAQSSGEATAHPRHRLASRGAFLHMLAGAGSGYFGYKAYTTGGGSGRFLFFLFDASSAGLVSVMEAEWLGQIRTGAATGLATRLLASEDVKVATLFGAGFQAESQLLGMASVRSLDRIWVVNRSRRRAVEFIERMSPHVAGELLVADSAEEAVRASRLVTTITASREPVLLGGWIEDGTHVNAAGGNMMLRREVDTATVLRADRIVVDSIEQARVECGEFVSAFTVGRRHWDEVVELKDAVANPVVRGPADVTLFKSLGIGLEDVALGAVVYERAKARGVGRPLDL